MMRMKVTQAAIDRFAAASEDHAALHKPKENKRSIAHGMYIMGAALSMYTKLQPKRWIRCYEMQFVSPVYAETEICMVYNETQSGIEVIVTSEYGETVARGVFYAEG
ncbi:hypothetical protein B9G55_05085 [Saccharibacillus sp. O16]|nr:hypothetical protein B9G55_05085 [Saccharibacillus sp. O16]